MRTAALVVLLLLLPGVPNQTGRAGAEPKASIVIEVDASADAGRFDPALIANVGYDPLYAVTTSREGQAAFRVVRQTRALHYIRCHNYLSDGLLQGRPNEYGGCRIYSEDEAGNPQYSWWFLDHVLDVIVAAGMKPILECDFMPDALAAGRIVSNYGGGAINKPKDYRKWQQLIFELVRHCEQRYGSAEVRTWRFEIWNEPDLGRYWIGGKWPGGGPVSESDMADFCRLYDHFVAGATAADPMVKVGGPGLAGDLDFLARFLHHCVSGTNFVTGERGSRIDFISWHTYGTLEANLAKIRAARSLITRRFPSLADRELQVNEWGQRLKVGGQPNRSLSVFSNYEAALMCALLDRVLSDATCRVDLLLRWGQIVMVPPRPGWRPLLVAEGEDCLPLALFNAYVLLAKMGPRLLPDRVSDASGEVGAVATASERGLQVLVYRFVEADEFSAGASVPARLRLVRTSFADGLFSAKQYRIDLRTANPFAAWLEAGRPRLLSTEWAETLLAAARLTPVPLSGTVRDGGVELEMVLPPNSVSLLVIGEELPPQPVTQAQRWLEAEQELERAAAAEARGHFAEAISRCQAIAGGYSDVALSQEALRRLVAIYEQRLGDPGAADFFRQSLLATELDDTERAEVLLRRAAYLDAKAQSAEAARLRQEAQAIARRLQALRR